LLALFLVSVVLNYAWEVSQAFLYQGMVSSRAIWLHCFVAALGDGLILGLIHLCGCILFKDFQWSARLGLLRFVFMTTSGLVISIAIEWVAVHQLHRWSYTDQMPMLPGMDIGLVPVMQMVLLPPIIFCLTNYWTRQKPS